MDGKKIIRCLQIISQHVPIYLQQFSSYSNRKCKKSPFSRTAAHIFVSPGDAPTIITQYVAWVERQFNACQTPRSMYLSIFNNFRVIRCLSQCVSPKIAIFTTVLFTPGDASGAITLNVVWMEREFDAYKLSRTLATCAHLTITVSDIQRDISEKIVILSYPLHSTSPLGGFPSEYQHPLFDRKTIMVSLPGGEKISKISLFVLTWSTHVTDRQTDTAWQQRPRLCICIAR